MIKGAFFKRVFGLVIDFGTPQSPKSTRPLTTYWCPSSPGHPALRNNFASSLLFRTCLPSGAMRTTGKQCGLAATGGYQPSLRSPWLAAVDGIRNTHYPVNYTFSTCSTNDGYRYELGRDGQVLSRRKDEPLKRSQQQVPGSGGRPGYSAMDDPQLEFRVSNIVPPYIFG
ncbi:hypothetical protein [Thiolapillus sp.]|uniref:hypothetical protein n=2 Tax=Thiolapillus sp. TaxID=2017437 RepID=UPI003AF51194